MTGTGNEGETERGPEAWLPPGQIATRRFPLVGEAAPDARRLRAEAWRVRIDGLVEAPRTFTFADLRALPAQRIRQDLHCVTGWSRRGSCFEGPRLAALLGAVGVKRAARFVRLEAVSERGHDTTLPLDLALGDTWVVHTMDGAPLSHAHGGPVRTLTPSKYLFKSLKWLRRVELLATDRPGYWEREAGYHNEADPWRPPRFVTGDLKPGDVARFRSARRYAPYRGKKLLGVQLAGWAPKDLDLRDLVIRGSDLRGARLARADLRGTNLSSSDLSGADLRGANLRGADIEGVDLRGADCRDLDLRGAKLTAVRLAHPATRVEGLRWEATAGLLEVDEDFLRAAGVEPRQR